ncbi:MAG: hypothetical protein GY935_01225 [Gammaproteobacteria bacterium]|nr:hypothetical protein [Gammaproteobacteria bacterium]
MTIIGLFSVSQLAYSEPITDTYNTGDTLTASKLNIIKSAVNDNDVRITALESLSGTTSYLSIPARGGFVAFDTNNAFAGCAPNTFSWAGVGSSLFTAMVNLPHNSTITGFTYYFWRGSPALETTAALYRQAIPASSREEIGSFTSTAADSGHTSGAAPTIDVTRAVVDNQNFTYYIQANLREAGSLCVDGASITYTTP